MNYLGFTYDELVTEYAPSSMVGGDISHYVAAYAAMSEKARRDFPVREDLAFGPSATQLLDYFPAKNVNAPLHVFIHGGYWQALGHKQSAMMAADILDSGMAFATINYTLAPDARMPEIVAECHQAMAWLGENADDLGFDRSHVTLSGHSAGGHLAAMMISEPERGIGKGDLTVTDAVLISGVFDLEPISRVPVNDPLQLTNEEIRSCSPMNLMPDGPGRVHVVVGARDTPEFVRQSRCYAEKLRIAGHPVGFDLRDGMNHFDIVMNAATFLRQGL